MPNDSDTEAFRFAAQDNLRRFLIPGARLPSRVFSCHRAIFRFFSSDMLLREDFVLAVQELLRIEDGVTACLLNVSQSPPWRPGDKEAVYLNFQSRAADFVASSRSPGVLFNLAVLRQTFASASDAGRWCIYGDGLADVAVVAIPDEHWLARFESPLSLLRALPLEQAFRVFTGGIFAFNTPVRPEWLSQLRDEYGFQ